MHRRLEGCIGRVPTGFYEQVWEVVSRSQAGLKVQGHRLPHQPTLSDMTASELNFSLLVEDLLNQINQPEYRQIIVEVKLCY